MKRLLMIKFDLLMILGISSSVGICEKFFYKVKYDKID